MASHQITIAKASLSASLLRPDPVSVARDDITYFHTSLDRTLSHCSPANIQTCKSWLLNNVILSSNRVGGLGKYLVALSGSLISSPSLAAPGKSTGNNRSNVSTSKISAKRKRLHILYLLNDLLHHTKYHGDTSATFSTLSGSLQPHLVELFGLAASFEREKNPKHHKRLDEVLDIWAENGYYSEEYVKKLREAVKNSASVDAIKASLASPDEKADAEKAMPVKDAPYVMPATHGDPSTPYYDLPAGNLMPHIIPNSTAAIRPQAVKPLQFLAGPADESLANAVKTFLKDVDKMYNTGDTVEDDGVVVEIDALGQKISRDKATGDMIGGESYYGWSLDFCQKMKKRREEGNRSRSRSRSRSRNQNPDRSQSSSPRKRRRYSDSVSSRSRSPARERSRHHRTYSNSRSPPPPRATRRRSRSRSSSRSKSRSYTPDAPSKFQQRRSFPPPPPPPVPQMPFNGDQNFNPPPPSLGPGGLPVPPPPPPNYQGPWPPPPPPPPQPSSHSPPQHGGFPNMPLNMNMNMSTNLSNMNMPGFPAPNFQQQQGGQQFSPPHPPPPPPMHQAQAQMQMPMQPGNFPFPQPFGQGPHQQHRNQDQWRQGQMGNGGGGGGRGGYHPSSRGRGRGWH